MMDRKNVILAIKILDDFFGDDNKIHAVLPSDAWEIVRELLKEQEDLGTELTNAVELIHKKNERIKKLLKEQEVRELTMDEWREWKNNPKRNPICKLWEHDTSPMWIIIPDDVHEPALLMGKLKLFTGRPTLEQCKEVKWE